MLFCQWHSLSKPLFSVYNESKMKPSLTVLLGSSADIFYGIDSYPSEGDFTHAREVTKSAGGPPLNAGCVCASKGGRVNALDCLNPKDETTDIILEALRKNHVNTDAVVYDEGCTNGKVLIFNHRNGLKNFVVVDHNSSAGLQLVHCVEDVLMLNADVDTNALTLLLEKLGKFRKAMKSSRNVDHHDHGEIILHNGLADILDVHMRIG